MCSHDLPDMYALSPRAPGIHIRQIPRSHVTTITYYNEAMYVYCLSDYALLHEAICMYYYVDKTNPQNP